MSEDIGKKLLDKILLSKEKGDLMDRLGHIMNTVLQISLKRAGIIDPNDKNIYRDLKLETWTRIEERLAEGLKMKDKTTPVMDSVERENLRKKVVKAGFVRNNALGGNHYNLTPEQEDLFEGYYIINKDLHNASMTPGDTNEQVAVILEILRYDFPELLEEVFEDIPESERDKYIKESKENFYDLLYKFIEDKGEGEKRSSPEGKKR